MTQFLFEMYQHTSQMPDGRRGEIYLHLLSLKIDVIYSAHKCIKKKCKYT